MFWIPVAAGMTEWGALGRQQTHCENESRHSGQAQRDPDPGRGLRGWQIVCGRGNDVWAGLVDRGLSLR